ncbi:hypothetical protein MUN76_04230 [Leucobacter rhizosphaerae]|uniref:Phospholipase D-like domain-containing protein n=1 Tax=Leucobacter rhizosphaerae TaxID=2932245 RepID=A0ABY4FYI7_9MICO|nr:hypothetical protein [Leucobacter rhizosphaerae]UOQ61184.1 hypothetical protein MUN76_04230 [Leucobacter rhizosphaerae]
MNARVFMTARAQYIREANTANPSRTAHTRRDVANFEDSCYQVAVHAQDSAIGRVGVVLKAIAHAADRAGDYECIDIAVAYASAEGVRLLENALAGPSWAEARKRFLVSLDFGFTQPKALTRLTEISRAEVRVPNGREVLRSAALQPQTAFHAKVYSFGVEEYPHLRALVVGSANLTASALSTGAEVVTSQTWKSYATAWNDLRRAQPVLDWFEDTWENADAIDDVFDEYRQKRRALKMPPRIQEERTPATRRYLASLEDHEISGDLSVQLAAAKELWIHASSMIRNRGDLPGSQINTPRGTRVFFGFPSEKRSRNTTLGSINLRVTGHAYHDRTLRFGDNGMDVINLPIPEQNGVETYLGTFLLFSRDSPEDENPPYYTLTVTDAAGIDAKKASAANSVDLTMNGGREYGLLF